jgi:alpha-amylase
MLIQTILKTLITTSIFVFVALGAPTAFAATSEIMLEGFHWNSYNTPGGWYNIIKQNTPRIKDIGFTIVWFPPPSKSADNQGYLPNELDNLDSRYGTKADLKSAISGLKPEVKSIADIVINHRNGTSNFADFTNPNWSTHTIVSNDEWGNSTDKSINGDTGDGINSGRDLDHLNPETIDGIEAWMDRLKSKVGFAGWRYDLVKGYLGQVIQKYNDRTNPAFTVGEFFDYDPKKVVNWIDSTHQNSQKRATGFDFPLRNTLYEAVVNKNYHWLKFNDKSPGVIGLWSDKAVTFIENHDTEESRNGAYASAFPDDDRMLQGYAFILTHPGTPCVFWRDIFDNTTERSNQLKTMIEIRQKYGINSESKVFIAQADRGLVYSAYITGSKGEVAIKIGPGAWQPTGNKWDGSSDLMASGSDYAIWGENGWNS